MNISSKQPLVVHCISHYLAYSYSDDINHKCPSIRDLKAGDDLWVMAAGDDL
jgi:hypothetical protein